MNRLIAYQITCVATEKKYIGITSKLLCVRWASHTYNARHGRKSPLYAAMRKYGVDLFAIKEIVEASSRKELCAIERGLIAEHGTYHPAGYNLTIGGDSGKGTPFSVERKKSHSDAALRRYREQPDIRDRLVASRKRALDRPEVRLRYSAATKKIWDENPKLRVAASARAKIQMLAVWAARRAAKT